MAQKWEPLYRNVLKEEEVRTVVDPIAKELGYEFKEAYHYDPSAGPHPNMSSRNYAERSQFSFNYKNPKSKGGLRVFSIPYLLGLDPTNMGVEIKIPHLSDSDEMQIAEIIAARYNSPNVGNDEFIFPTGTFKDRDAFIKLMPNSIRALVFACEDLATALEKLEEERERKRVERKGVLKTYIPEPRRIAPQTSPYAPKRRKKHGDAGSQPNFEEFDKWVEDGSRVSEEGLNKPMDI